MERKNGIDLFRLIGAFFILFIHIKYENISESIVSNIRLSARWVVPFFFITSGYFIGNKINGNSLDFAKIRKNISILITVFIIASVIYIPGQILKTGKSIDNTTFVTGTYFHLWFIGSLLVGYLFIWYCYEIKKAHFLPYIAIVLLALALLTDSYDLFFSKQRNYDFFRTFQSVPFMYIGISIQKRNFKNISKGLLITFIIIGFAIQKLETQLFYNLFHYNPYDHELLIGTCISAISLFILSLNLNLKQNIVSKLGKDHSLFIYLYHIIFYKLFYHLHYLIFPDKLINSIYIYPFIIFFISLSFSILLEKISPRLFKLLNGVTKSST